MTMSGFLQAAALTSMAFASASASQPSRTETRGASAVQQTAARRIWAAISVSSPLVRGEQVNVSFAATNLGTAPVRMTAVREDIVLLINGEEWKDSHFAFGNGPHACGPNQPACVLNPGESTLFTYQLTELFKNPGVYRLQWKGNGFESLPIEFQVVR